MNYQTTDSPTSDNSSDSSSGQQASKRLPLTQISKHVYIGSFDLSLDCAKLQKYHITHVLNLTTRYIEVDSCLGIDYLNCSVSSKSFRAFMGSIPQCIEYLDNALINNHNILICCRDGLSRTLAVLHAYQILKYHLDFSEAKGTFRCTDSFSGGVSPEYEQHLKQMCSLVRKQRSPS